MKFVADEGIDVQIVAHLRDAGADVVFTRPVQPQRNGDVGFRCFPVDRRQSHSLQSSIINH